MIKNGKSKKIAAIKSDISLNTAKKYLNSGQLPDQMKKDHDWKTRKDPFENDWNYIKNILDINPGLQSKFIFKDLKKKSPGKYQDGQLRTLQRKVKIWRATEGPQREVYFPQEHFPGDLSCSDFTHMDDLNITILHKPFVHLIYHFVLTYSNWEHGSICFSESFEALSGGFQNAIWRLGGVPKRHRTDNLSAAVNNLKNKEFTENYKALLSHYEINGVNINPRRPNENGDVEVSHSHFKNAVDQTLMLRGSRDFQNLEEYEAFLQQVFDELNESRSDRFQEEKNNFNNLPNDRLDDFRVFSLKVSKYSTINILNNVYSVPSRLIKENIKVKLYMDHLEIIYGGKRVDTFKRLRGNKKSRINYRHIIDSLLKKPGAFSNYRYRLDLFPTSYFRIAFDQLKEKSPGRANKIYLEILSMAAQLGEEITEKALIQISEKELDLTIEQIEKLLPNLDRLQQINDPHIDKVDLNQFDSLIGLSGVLK